jgi:hypothetical protein
VGPALLTSGRLIRRFILTSAPCVSSGLFFEPHPSVWGFPCGARLVAQTLVCVLEKRYLAETQRCLRASSSILAAGINVSVTCFDSLSPTVTLTPSKPLRNSGSA